MSLLSLKTGYLVNGIVKSKCANGVVVSVGGILCDMHYHHMKDKVSSIGVSLNYSWKI